MSTNNPQPPPHTPISSLQLQLTLMSSHQWLILPMLVRAKTDITQLDIQLAAILHKSTPIQLIIRKQEMMRYSPSIQ